jgi:hypothetical protein
MDNAISVRSLLGVPVRFGNLTVAVVEDIFLARGLERAVGVSFADGTGRCGLLPWLALAVEHARVRLTAPSLVRAATAVRAA